MVNYEEEYDKFEDTPNHIDYGSWYEYDNFQDFIDGKNAMDLTEGEEINYMISNLPEESILDFNDLRDDESIYLEEYLDQLIERKISEKIDIEEFLNSIENDNIDNEYLEKLFLEDNSIDEDLINDYKNSFSDAEINERMILEHLIGEYLLKDEELFKDFLKSKDLEERIDDDYEDIFYEDYYDDYAYDGDIEEKYFEHIEYMDDLHWKMMETNKGNRENEDSFNEVTDYGDNPFGE